MNKLRVIFIAMLAAAFIQDVRAERRLALIITNQGYSADIGALSKSHADGEILAKALREAGFDVRIAKDVNRSRMLEVISEYSDQLSKARSDGIGFFYYSGHGASTDKFGDNYLIPLDSPVDAGLQLTTLGVKLGDVIETLSQTNAQVNFVVIDACRNVASSLNRGQKGLKPELERSGVLIEFSTGPGDVAADDNIFSTALAGELTKRGREAAQVFRAVRLKVLDATGNRQFPWTRDGLIRDFWFAGPPEPDAAAAQLSSARMLAEWDSLKDSGDTSLLEKFEQHYSGDLLSAEAKRRRLELGAQKRLASASNQEAPITIWNVASPYFDPSMEMSSRVQHKEPIGYVPPRLGRRAAELGYSIKVEVIPAKEFASRLFASMGTANEPDVISIDNYGHLQGITTAQGKIEGIWTNNEVHKNLVAVEEVLGEFAAGWQFLLRGSPNHSKARAFVEDLVDCDEVLLSAGAPDMPELRRVNEAAVVSHVECRPLDGDLSDPASFATGCAKTDAPLRVKVLKTCQLSGNTQLAFGTSVVAIDSHERVGRRTVASVIRKTGKWRALAVTADPLTAKEFAADAIPFARRLTGAPQEASPALPAAILTPDGTYPAPEAGARFGNFNWEGSPSAGVRGEVAEFNYGHGIRLFLLPGAAPNQKRQISSGKLWTTKTPWVWRIWSVRGDGSIAFSDTRQFRH